MGRPAEEKEEASGGNEVVDGVECCKESSCDEPDCAFHLGLPCTVVQQRKAAGNISLEKGGRTGQCRAAW